VPPPGHRSPPFFWCHDPHGPQRFPPHKNSERGVHTPSSEGYTFGVGPSKAYLRPPPLSIVPLLARSSRRRRLLFSLDTYPCHPPIHVVKRKQFLRVDRLPFPGSYRRLLPSTDPRCDRGQNFILEAPGDPPSSARRLLPTFPSPPQKPPLEGVGLFSGSSCTNFTPGALSSSIFQDFSPPCLSPSRSGNQPALFFFACG